MLKSFQSTTIESISLALHVPPNSGKHQHSDRLFHGLVINDANAVKDYCFSDGQVMRTEGFSLFYLPKHSTYHVNTIQSGGCYAINFEADLDSPPFAVNAKGAEALRKNFRLACDEWRRHSPASRAAAMCALYDAIRFLCRQETYMPKQREDQIAPALDEIERSLCDNSLTVSHLAALCGLSEVYLRRIFTCLFGVSPKEYIIRERMEYAKQLLSVGELEVAEVAAHCGYSEPCHFSREFKKRIGITPEQYK